MTPRVLIIAGSDSGGGAGIQADIKAVTMLGGHAMTAITAITAQNTLGVDAVHPIPTEMVIAQINAVVRDIGVDAIKIGMIGSAATAHAVAERLESLPGVPVVFDPVMVASSGAELASGETIAAFKRLMDCAAIVTPNMPELEALGASAEALVQAHGCAVLAKGGHGSGALITDRLYSRSGNGVAVTAWSGSRIDSKNNHGTGCTLASAIACGLAAKWSLPDAIARARSFVRIAMQEAPGLGAGFGPMGHQLVRLDNPLSQQQPMLNQITVPLDDFAASEAFYLALGLRQLVRSEGRYARFESAGGATFSIEARDEMQHGAVTYFECGNLEDTVAYLQRQGIEFLSEPRDTQWGWREARLLDPANNPICLYHAGEMRRFPPWRLEDN